jgi:ABC-type phosphate/phosphonate transport system substrate-binding protein
MPCPPTTSPESAPLCRPQATAVAICLPVELGAKQEDCTGVVAMANTDAVQFSCTGGASSVQGCIDQVRSGEAQLAKIPASGLAAASQAGLAPLAAENFPGLDANTEGYAVAAVSSDLCASAASAAALVAALKGKSACFGGYATDGAWQVPVGVLAKNGMPPKEGADYTMDASSVSAFFKSVSAGAAARAGAAGPPPTPAAAP